VAEKRYAARGHDPKVIGQIAVPTVIAGVIGARIYHLFTGYKWSDGGVVGAFEIWKGGLSIWGAVVGGAIAVIVVGRRRNLDVLELMDAIAPGVVLAQAIGRWGNYFNQELFGRPTSLPWGLEIDIAHRPGATQSARRSNRRSSTSHLVPRRVRNPLVVGTPVHFRRGQTFALYVRSTRLVRVVRSAPRRRRDEDLRHPLQPVVVGCAVCSQHCLVRAARPPGSHRAGSGNSP
jgi:prolipoprotein diacylglyceryl transferase